MQMRILKSESGQVLAMTVLSMSLLLACVALAVDVGLLFRAKRNAQIAADAAAVAAALAAQYPGTVSSTQAAYNAAAENGITNSNQVLVTPSPTDGYHTGPGYIKVVIDQPNQTFFMSMFGFSTVTVGARAVAGLTPAPACLYVLDPTDKDTLYIKGSGQITAPKCGIQVNSTSKDATCNQGAAQISGPYLHIAGGQDVGGPCKATPGTPVVTGAAPVGDPFNNLTGPTPTNGECTSTSTVTTISASLTGPGTGNSICYTKAVTISGGGSGITLGAGTYVFEAGVTLSGTITVNSGTIDIEQGTFSQGNANLNITAPTSGTYNGIAIMQPSTNTTASTCKGGAGTPCLQIQFGSGTENLTGLIYAPTSEVYMQDEGGGVQAGGVVAYQIYVNSDLILTDSYNDSNASTTPLRKVALVE